eukprot:CAMPEP_0183726332 /NCGR_PEP_ID=MMETSP0737-20130205/23058_1 /TAXON_ID=385413 /ORGANISM="Thalassiosira miniscula, Strain CCMP1093" /LENGTH=413 /DNA_ID=CAMNT_0025957649 /DNA_START=135 /DNA_END=1376 /DNA_ORIENTATION=-
MIDECLPNNAPKRPLGPKQYSTANKLLITLGALFAIVTLNHAKQIMNFEASLDNDNNGKGKEAFITGAPQEASSLATKDEQTKTMVQDVREEEGVDPPEPLDTMDYCAENCFVRECLQDRYVHTMSLPAPTCNAYSEIYWNDMLIGGGQGINAERNAKTTSLVSWGAERARHRRQGSNAEQTTVMCEDVPTKIEQTKWLPEEFEFVTKLMINRRPSTYLEWGVGTLTSFYPLLVSDDVLVIDGNAATCEKMAKEPHVGCMVEKEKRLTFYCPEEWSSGNLKLQKNGKLSMEMADEDVKAAMEDYVTEALADALSEKPNISHFDMALINSNARFPAQLALRLLPFLHPDSVLVMHNFWLRTEAYHPVLEYYDVIGYARSAVALKKKVGELSAEEERTVYRKYMKKEHLTSLDIV